ncbi:MAG: hypothetical protein IKG52_06130 [Rhodobacteraceae bacterium]|nr:hypothetical protein [Paracoccaceae bacterium]
MRRFAPIVFCACLAIGPGLHASDAPDPPEAGQGDSVFGLIDRMLRGFLEDVDPHMRKLDRDMQALEPEMRRLFGQLRDMVDYHPPEMLPNGDILIRRRAARPDADDDDQAAPPDAGDDADAPSALEL